MVANGSYSNCQSLKMMFLKNGKKYIIVGVSKSIQQ